MDGDGGEGSGELLALKQHLWLSEYAQELVGRVAEGNGSDVEVEQVNKIHDETEKVGKCPEETCCETGESFRRAG